ncbi:MAG: DUF309 domain-containing protein [Synechococcales cyanobacterium K44_A2020_017]|nr:DUF309 domain-containing protein [Synechococcales cyanobacterium K32_A2020_035]MBF2093970.1 DUF309 domain-containing protein [Synechococcales cyanobacterium K44_A2020_017]
MTDPIPADFWQGVDQFNQGDFYACHDTLEAIWMEAPHYQKGFYQGVLQLAVALYHLSNHNWRGSATLLGEGVHRLAAYPSDYAEIDVAQLMRQSAVLLRSLQELGPDEVEAIAQQVFHPVDPAQSLCPVIRRVDADE